MRTRLRPVWPFLALVAIIVVNAREGSVTRLPAFLHEPFAAAMSQSLLLPAFFALFGVVAAIFIAYIWWG